MSNEMLYLVLMGYWLPWLFAVGCVWGAVMLVSRTVGIGDNDGE